VADLLSTLGSAMLLSRHELMRLVMSAPRRYKVYSIAKRTPGQFRVIAQPAREVKALQYWVMRNVLAQFPIHSAATGYREGLNISDNALPHTTNKFLLKLDFREFFPSLKARDFHTLLARRGVQISETETNALTRILFWKPKGTNDMRLSIGAPSSPMLSNILMMEFDATVSEFCVGHGVVYTRYADDLSFSARLSSSLQETEGMVIKLCKRLRSPKLTLNVTVQVL
jgi:RNA-directed DNA polymerase